jgi:transcriptional regulator with XRE-family HTH domain
MGRPIGKRKATTREQSIGAVLTELRLNKGISYQTVAFAVGCNDAYLHRVETGKTNPTIKLLQAIADYHRVKLSRIIGMAEDKYARRPRTKKS